MEKFIVTEQGYYSGYSKNGTIPMNEEFNLSNLPTKEHSYVDGNWVLDKDLHIAKLEEEVRATRASLYNIGEQVGAMVKQFKYDNMQNGKELIQELDDAIAAVQQIKNNNPKPEETK